MSGLLTIPADFFVTMLGISPCAQVFFKQYDRRVAFSCSGVWLLSVAGVTQVKDHIQCTSVPCFHWPARLLSQPSGPVLSLRFRQLSFT